MDVCLKYNIILQQKAIRTIINGNYIAYTESLLKKLEYM